MNLCCLTLSANANFIQLMTRKCKLRYGKLRTHMSPSKVTAVFFMVFANLIAVVFLLIFVCVQVINK